MVAGGPKRRHARIGAMGHQHRRPSIVVLTSALAVLSIAGRVEAECENKCNQAADHWAWQQVGVVGSPYGYVGMNCGATFCTPMLCAFNILSGQFEVAGWVNRLYYGLWLTGETSFCLSDGQDQLVLLRYGDTITCQYNGQPVLVTGFLSGGHNLTVSMMGGSYDKLVSNYVGDMTVCGGDGPDDVYTSGGHQYILGQYGDDLIVGGDDDDNIRGGGDKDVLQHLSGPNTFPGVDKLRGDSMTDCVYITAASFNPDSSCGGSEVDYYRNTGRSSYPASCERSIAQCTDIWQ
jgi:hypothetical protein